MGDMADEAFDEMLHWLEQEGDEPGFDFGPDVPAPQMPCCDYCGRIADLRDGRDVYPHRPDLKRKYFWVCEPCDARVGCHPRSDIPLGSLANAELRRDRAVAHEHFDAIWKSGRKRRRSAYAWLAKKLDIPVEECHIGHFDSETCRRVVAICCFGELE